MISKVIQGNSFPDLCRYLCQKEKYAEVIDSCGVRDYDHKLMARDFEDQRSLNPGLKNPILHVILSYYPGEKISDEKMAEIAREYMQELKLENTQYVVVKHTDRKHLHTHIVINRVDNDGKTLKDNWIGLKGKKTAQRLTIKHELIQSLRKNLTLTNLERLNGYEATRYEIYQAILDTLPKCRNLGELLIRLERQNIEMIYKYKAQTKEVQGVSFKKGDYKFKGSEIDRQFSYLNLEKFLSLKQELKQRHPRASIDKGKWEQIAAILNVKQGQEKSLIEELLKPERNDEQTPYELLKKKRIQLSRGHHL